MDMTRRLMNLTPHAIDIVTEDGTLSIAPEARPARLVGRTEPDGTIAVDGLAVPLLKHRYDVAVDLPDPEDGVLLIVAQVVLDFLPEREDLVTPTELVRDEVGRVIGCRALGRRG